VAACMCVDGACFAASVPSSLASVQATTMLRAAVDFGKPVQVDVFCTQQLLCDSCKCTTRKKISGVAAETMFHFCGLGDCTKDSYIATASLVARGTACHSFGQYLHYCISLSKDQDTSDSQRACTDRAGMPTVVSLLRSGGKSWNVFVMFWRWLVGCHRSPRVQVGFD